MQSTMNLKIKYRESFRPFAPAVLEEQTEDWFDLTQPPPPTCCWLRRWPPKGSMPQQCGPGQESGHIPERQIRESGIREWVNERRSEIPAVTHVDGSARVQTVSATRNPRLHEILKAFEARTGCGVIINTSFNVRGEPIVCTPSDAYRCFMRTGMDVLVLEDHVLMKSAQPKWPESRQLAPSLRSGLDEACLTDHACSPIPPLCPPSPRPDRLCGAESGVVVDPSDGRAWVDHDLHRGGPGRPRHTPSTRFSDAAAMNETEPLLDHTWSALPPSGAPHRQRRPVAVLVPLIVVAGTLVPGSPDVGDHRCGYRADDHCGKRSVAGNQNQTRPNHGFCRALGGPVSDFLFCWGSCSW